MAVSVRNHFTPFLPKLNPGNILLPSLTTDENLDPTVKNHGGFTGSSNTSACSPPKSPAPRPPPRQPPTPLPRRRPRPTPTLCESPTLPGLLDSIPRDLFLWPERAKRVEGSDAPAWDSPDPPGPDHALHPDSHPGHDEDDRDDGPDPDSENIAQDRLELALPATAPPVSPRAGKRASQPLIRARREA